MTLPTYHVAQITFSSDETFTFSPNDKVIIVGANNSGKSRLLKDIEEWVTKSNKGGDCKVVKDLVGTIDGSWDSVRSYISENGTLHDGHYFINGVRVNAAYLGRGYTDNERYFGPLFVKRISAEDRLKICEPQDAIAHNQQPTKPQHLLYSSDALMRRISGLFAKAFGQQLFLNFRGGKTIPIHVGTPPKATKAADRVSDAYVEKVLKYPALHQQGDGMRSFAGLLFEGVVTKKSINLVDEPEAFLHPPQMRRLGSILATEVDGQLFCSTHSADILKGFLDGTNGKLRILRIQQINGKNFVCEASPELVQELWKRPVLRYSNALEGIFHEQALICEDDSDCRLYNAVEDYLVETGIIGIRDTAYVPAGGKDAMPKIGKALHALGVPTKMVFDIDVIATPSTLEAAVSALGGNWADIEGDCKIVKSQVESSYGRKLSDRKIKEKLRDMLDADQDLIKNSVLGVFDGTKPWTAVKNGGQAAIPNGDASAAFERIVLYLREMGIFIVPAGQPESFCKSLGTHGPAFVTKLLEERDLGSKDLAELRTFVSTMVR